MDSFLRVRGQMKRFLRLPSSEVVTVTNCFRGGGENSVSDKQQVCAVSALPPFSAPLLCPDLKRWIFSEFGIWASSIFTCGSQNAVLRVKARLSTQIFTDHNQRVVLNLFGPSEDKITGKQSKQKPKKAAPPIFNCRRRPIRSGSCFFGGGGKSWTCLWSYFTHLSILHAKYVIEEKCKKISQPWNWPYQIFMVELS